LVTPPEFLPKDEFENLKPDLSDDGKSVSITYEWTNTPFTLPPGSKEHPLYQNWKDAEKSINAYIDRIRENISENEKAGNKVSKLIARLFLTKQQKFSEYRNDLDKLQKIKYSSVNKTELEENIKQINVIRSAVEKDSSEISEENRKARLQEQIEAKKKEKAELEAKLDETRQILQEAEKDIEVQSGNLKELEKQGEEKKEELKEARKKLEDLKVAKNKTANDISSLGSQIKNITADEKSSTEQSQAKEKLESKLGETQQILQETEKGIEIQSGNLKELEEQDEGKKREIKEAGKKLDDLKVTKNKTANEINSLESQIKKNNDYEKSLTEQLKKPAKEPPKKESVLSGLHGDEKKQNQSGQIGELPVPQFPQLPSLGVLYKQNNQDYLAIQYWEDYDQGKVEADRLKAKLCAKGENNG
jgi:chromosome segregation ATPase